MLRFTTYNIAFGFNARTLPHYAVNHLILHGTPGRVSAKLLSRKVDRAVSLACSAGADFLCLNEVPNGSNTPRVIEKLRNCGYSVIQEVEESHRPMAIRMKTILATKNPSAVPIPIKLSHLEKYAGGGGGCAFEIKNESLVVAGVHLSVVPSFRHDQLKELAKFMKLHSVRKNVVLMGDFNCDLDEIRAHPAWLGISWDGCDEVTSRYSMFSWLNFPGNIDHIIFTPKLSITRTEVVKDTSDHYLLTCNIVERARV